MLILASGVSDALLTFGGLRVRMRGNEEAYPKYDNYDAIEVSKVSDIPCDCAAFSAELLSEGKQANGN